TTQFDRLIGPLAIDQGVLRLPRIELLSQNLGTRGEVLVNLADGALGGELRLQNDRLDGIPLALGGTVSEPQITPDFSTALRQEAGRRVLDLLEQRLNEDDNDREPNGNEF
ncbi:MAG: hypothetical protein AAGH65_09890, partial [Pseudomonadota bacterium]